MHPEIEALFLKQAGAVRASVFRIMIGLARCIQRERLGRSYPGESKQPETNGQSEELPDTHDNTENRPCASGSRPKRRAFLIRTLKILIRMPLPRQPLLGMTKVWQGLERLNWAILVRDALGERKRE